MGWSAADNQIDRFAFKGGVGDLCHLNPVGHPPKGKVETPRKDLFKEHIGSRHDHLEGDIRVLAMLDLQCRQNAVEGGAGHCPDADLTDIASGNLCQIAGGIIKFDPDALGALGKGTAKPGHFDAAPGAFVHRMSDDLFNLGHQTRGGGLRNADGGGGLGQLTGFRQRRQQPQMAEFEALSQQGIGAVGLAHIIPAMFLSAFII